MKRGNPILQLECSSNNILKHWESSLTHRKCFIKISLGQASNIFFESADYKYRMILGPPNKIININFNSYSMILKGSWRKEDKPIFYNALKLYKERVSIAEKYIIMKNCEIYRLV